VKKTLAQRFCWQISHHLSPKENFNLCWMRRQMVSNFNHSQIVATMGCLLHTHTHLYFFGAILCDFAPFLQNLGFFLCQQINDLLGKKGQNPPPKKSSFTYTWSKLVAKKYIYMDVRFFPSYF